jgi:hypothetical protein
MYFLQSPARYPLSLTGRQASQFLYGMLHTHVCSCVPFRLIGFPPHAPQCSTASAAVARSGLKSVTGTILMFDHALRNGTQSFFAETQGASPLLMFVRTAIRGFVEKVLLFCSGISSRLS